MAVVAQGSDVAQLHILPVEDEAQRVVGIEVEARRRDVLPAAEDAIGDGLRRRVVIEIDGAVAGRDFPCAPGAARRIEVFRRAYAREGAIGRVVGMTSPVSTQLPSTYQPEKPGSVTPAAGLLRRMPYQ